MQHASLSPERWSTIPLEQQVLMIGNEMNRASKLFATEDRDRLRTSYERVLRLVDLTVETQRARGLQKELLRWREVVGGLYESPDPALHRVAFRCLLQLHPVAARQIPHVLGGAGAAAGLATTPRVRPGQGPHPR
jgi:hypothetical protein